MTYAQTETATQSEVVLTVLTHGGLSRKLPISLPGVSIARIENGKITDWTDYWPNRFRGS